MRPIEFTGTSLRLLDQTLLPGEERRLDCTTPEEVADAIRRLAVRGAPAIGIAAACGLALAEPGDFDRAASLLGATRPTAVNLHWAIERMRSARDDGRDLVAEASAIAAEQARCDDELVRHGLPLFGEGERVLTHCNTGPLVTGARGTAGAVIVAGWEAGKVELVWVDETRPLLQGARLTSWELGRAGAPYRLITDSMAASVMARGLVDRVMVGADRIAANGDVANKIGTYGLAVLCAHHGIPFHVVAPLSTVDVATPSGEAIVIEERAPEEVTALGGRRVAPDAADAANYAFDVTPAGLVTSIVTEAGALRPDEVAQAAR
ncbi:MAG TPA: S-methyl-5-thioribose-1-phosphate isomerase [Solirubrobacteraceae bacterium]